MVSVDRILSRYALFAWVLLLGIPVIWPMAPELEGRLLPVVASTRIIGEQRTPAGAAFHVRFEKKRQCEFRGLNWYLGDTRLGVNFQPTSTREPISRPRGKQFTGPWVVESVQTLEGTIATVVHRCHPLWLTYTHFYP